MDIIKTLIFQIRVRPVSKLENTMTKIAFEEYSHKFSRLCVARGCLLSSSEAFPRRMCPLIEQNFRMTDERRTRNLLRILFTDFQLSTWFPILRNSPFVPLQCSRILVIGFHLTRISSARIQLTASHGGLSWA